MRVSNFQDKWNAAMKRLALDIANLCAEAGLIL
jgi:putative AlgH/UPF0301 family transcriptional regulator